MTSTEREVSEVPGGRSDRGKPFEKGPRVCPKLYWFGFTTRFKFREESRVHLFYLNSGITSQEDLYQVLSFLQRYRKIVFSGNTGRVCLRESSTKRDIVRVRGIRCNFVGVRDVKTLERSPDLDTTTVTI